MEMNSVLQCFTNSLNIREHSQKLEIYSNCPGSIYMTYFAPPISFMREAKKCFKNSQKEEIQNSNGWSYQKSVMVPMDRVQLSEDYQMLCPPGIY